MRDFCFQRKKNPIKIKFYQLHKNVPSTSLNFYFKYQFLQFFKQRIVEHVCIVQTFLHRNHSTFKLSRAFVETKIDTFHTHPATVAFLLSQRFQSSTVIRSKVFDFFLAQIFWSFPLLRANFSILVSVLCLP